jgi:hypothetical protein
MGCVVAAALAGWVVATAAAAAGGDCSSAVSRWRRRRRGGCWHTSAGAAAAAMPIVCAQPGWFRSRHRRQPSLVQCRTDCQKTMAFFQASVPRPGWPEKTSLPRGAPLLAHQQHVHAVERSRIGSAAAPAREQPRSTRPASLGARRSQGVRSAGRSRRALARRGRQGSAARSIRPRRAWLLAAAPPVRRGAGFASDRGSSSCGCGCHASGSRRPATTATTAATDSHRASTAAGAAGAAARAADAPLRAGP